MKIPFSPPFVDIDVVNSVVESLNSGWITSGPMVKTFENEITKFTNCDATVCVNSWTSGAILVLKWLGIKEGDEVIIPAYTYSATALAVIHAGGIPIMVDVLEDFTIDPYEVEKKITNKTKAIFAVDFGGLMCNYSMLKSLVVKSEVNILFCAESKMQEKLGRILIISDAAHSIGAYYKGVIAGTAADVTIFSFHAVKNITTAEGGAICLKLPSSFDIHKLYTEMKLWSLNGQNKDALTKAQAGSWKYDILFAGLKINMPDICAAIGLVQLRKYLNQLLPERKRVAFAYQEFFSIRPWAICPILKDDDRESCYHLFALRIKDCNEAQRDKMIDLITKHSVSVNVHFIPLPMLTLFKSMGYLIDNFPNSFTLYSSEISLPIYPQLTKDSIKMICIAVDEAYQQVFNHD